MIKSLFRIALVSVTVSSSLFAAISVHCEPGGDVGTIQGWSSAQIYEDPSEIAEGIFIKAILKIEPAVNGAEYIITDESGFFAVHDVPVGEYVIQPLHSPSNYSVKVNVARNQTSEITVLTPETGFYLYLFNCSDDNPPFNDRNVRKALAIAIDRSRLLAEVECTDRDPAFNFIPGGLLEGGWADGAATVSYSAAETEGLLENTRLFDFSISYNIVTGNVARTLRHENIAARVKLYYEALSRVGSVTLVSKEWDQHLDDYFRGNFDLLRMGWALDSNNILEFYKVFFGRGNILNYSNAILLNLLDQAQAALDEKSIPAYEDAILTINHLLIEDMPAIPIFYYR